MTGPDDPEAYGEGPPKPFCRAPNQQCVHMSECYPEKSCQFAPDESTYVSEQREITPTAWASLVDHPADPNCAVIVSEPTRLYVNGVLVDEQHLGPISSGDEITIRWPIRFDR